MLTDAVPRKNRTEYLKSDQITTLDLPMDRALQEIRERIENAMKLARMPEVRRYCEEFLTIASQFYRTPKAREKQGTLRLFSDCVPKHFWQRRFYDFNVWSCCDNSPVWAA